MPTTAPKQKKSSKILTKENILIVDDDPLVLSALEKILANKKTQILTAKNGEEAIRLLKKRQVAVIICDQGMPGMSGIEVLKHTLKIHPETVRIILTGSSDLETVIQAVNIGQISQFILKPWDNASLRQTVHSSLEQYQLQKENQRLQQLISLQHEALTKTHESLKHELRLGARIHEVLLLGKVPHNIPGIDIEATTIPSKDIDGDFFDFYSPTSKIFDVVIGDVMGKGIPAALVGTAVKTQLTRFALPYSKAQVIEKKGIWEDDLLSPQEILSRIHKELVPQLVDLEFFVSLFYARFHLQKRVLTYVDCGSTKPLHYHASQQKISELRGNSFPIGIVKPDSYQQFETTFQPEDLFIFYSDGMTEARSPKRALYGTERLKQLLQSNAQKKTSELLALMKQSVLDFSQKEYLDDDLTILIIKIAKKYDYPEVSQYKTAKFTSDLSQLKAVRDFVHRLCLQAPGDSLRLAIQLQLAINEAFCNIVKHGYKAKPGRDILISGELTEKGMLFEISDQGELFDPAHTQEPSRTGDKETGFGLSIIREVADKVTYTQKEAEAGWNHLSIFKRYFYHEGKMEITHTIQDNILIITPEGENLDATEAPHFKEQVNNLISNQDIRHVILDLHRLEFIDSSGLGSFLSILRLLNTYHGDLKLARMTKPIRTMIELVCMHKIFEIYNTTEDALRSFK